MLSRNKILSSITACLILFSAFAFDDGCNKKTDLKQVTKDQTVQDKSLSNTKLEKKDGFRIEKDLLGEKYVPNNAYYGVQTLRALENFQISGTTTKDYPELVNAFVLVKLAAIRANSDAGAIPKDVLEAVEKACKEVLAGKYHDQFQVDLYNGGGVTASHIAQWDGSSWSQIGPGINGIIYAVASGNGKLYAGGLSGSFQCITSWDGTSWSNLGSGVGGGTYPYVFSILVYGTDVYAAGLYTIAGGQTVNGIAKWNGSTWSGLGSGFGYGNASGAFATCIYNGKLVCGGIFSSPGNNIAQWDGLLTGINHSNQTIPDKYYLGQNYPNPFNPATNINFSIPKAGLVKLTVFDGAGREVSQMVNENLAAGNYSYSFNATGLASGAYFYMLKTNDDVEIRKMILVK